MAKHFGRGIARGMAVTLKNFFRRPVTLRYPEEKLHLSRRERGHVLSWSEKDCTGCYTCAQNCSHGCLAITTADEGIKWAPAPCSQHCPAGVDAARYIRAVAEGLPAEAVAVVRERIPFPSVCAYICAHPCEGACTRGNIDESIAIRLLKRYAVDNDSGIWKMGIKVPVPTGKSVAVIGAGPAGLTAAYYLARKGHRVTVYEELAVAGGMVRVGIPDYRLPKHLLQSDIKEIENAGVEIKLSSSVSSIQTLFDQGFQAVLVAVGAHQAQGLGVPGDDAPRVLGGVNFLRDVSLGREVKLGARVAVIGGGNTAMDCARTALRLGSKVSVIYRRTCAEMPAAPEEVEEARDEGVEFHFLAAPTKVTSLDGKLFLENIRMQLGAEDSSGRRRPEPVAGSEFVMELDNIIAAISQAPIVPAGFELPTDKSGRLQVDKATLATSVAGIFAAGDAVLGPATVIEGIAQGRLAAESIDKFLGGDGNIAERLAVLSETPKREGAPLLGLRPERKMLDPHVRRQSYDGVEMGWGQKEAQQEAGRCLRCDLRYAVTQYQLDGGLCIYCGLCVEACPFKALYMGTDYERWSYRFEDQILQKDDLAQRPRSGYAHAEVAETLPEQTLLLDRGGKGKKRK
ncbi:MAG: FAD-dependent oxidoreductase [Dehalococcoidia bacterium]|nr:FAD-dependent oxidoreductase [Dehalococcoidia bacterium]